MSITSVHVIDALNWLTNIDLQYNISNEISGIGDFIDDLKPKGYITEENEKGEFKLTAKREQGIRNSALEEIFGQLEKSY